ncbi:MAG: DUF1343 domain-containing protein [Myxococcota bacterium]
MVAAALVQTGLDRWSTSTRLRTGRWGLLAHPASVDGQLRHGLHLLRAGGVEVAALFGPEHGWSGAAQDMEAVAESHRVVSLYGADEASLRPRSEELEGLDGLIVDLQDVGARYYTYAATMAYCLEAFAEAGRPVVVLDRPNPLGGRAEDMEGPTVQPGYESFVSELPIPIRHGMTMGELARWCVAVRRLDVELEVVAMEGWRRAMFFDETSLPWVLPSPNMPTLDTAIVYPGQCLWEGTDFSEGRGTTRPFELVGGPSVNGEAWAKAAEPDLGPGLRLRPTGFKPTFQKHGGQHCGGVQLHVLDRARFRSVRASVALLVAARRLGIGLGWRREAYEFVDDRLAIDLLFGSETPRRLIDEGAPTEAVLESFGDFCTEFAEARAPYLLYD